MADYYKWKPTSTGFSKSASGIISNQKAILFIVIAGAVVYYFAIHRRRK